MEDLGGITGKARAAAQSRAAELEASAKKAAEYKAAPLSDELAKFIMARFSEAASHRMSSGIDLRVVKSLSAALGQFNPGAKAALLRDGSSADNYAYLGKTATKTKAGAAWVMDILVNHKDRPWTITATADPSVTDMLAEAATNEVLLESPMAQSLVDSGELEQMYARGAPLPAALNELIAAKTNDVKQRIRSDANKALARVSNRIHDRFIAGGWREAFRGLVDDVMTFPSGIIKGPFIVNKPVMRWVKEDNGKSTLKAVTEQVYTLQRVDPLDFYPAPDAASVESAAYIIETVRLNAEQMMNMVKAPGGLALGVHAVLNKNPKGSVLMWSSKDDINALRSKANISPYHDQTYLGTYECVLFSGRIEAALLRAHDVVIPEDRLFVEVEVWVCDNTIISARLSPHPLGTRPYLVTSFRKIVGSLWGQGIPDILEPVEKMCVQASTDLVDNISHSAGFYVEADVDRLSDPNAVIELKKNSTILTTTKDTAYGTKPSRVLNFYTVPNIAPSILSTMEYYAKMADDMSGIPAYVMGGPQAAGAAGRTLGGLALMMGAAAKGIKTVVLAFDSDVIEPMVKNAYIQAMLDPTTPEGDRVDADVVTNGSAGILMKELNKGGALDFLGVITPYVQAGLARREGVIYLLREAATAAGFDADTIADDPQKNMLQKPLEGAIPERTTPRSVQAAPGTPLPEMDGRSQPPPDPTLNERV